MADYKRMYTMLFNQISNTIIDLQKIQQYAENCIWQQKKQIA